jgi:hypothetical protein
MKLTVDQDVERLASCIQENFAADWLLGITGGLQQIAPLLWGQLGNQAVAAFSLESEPMTPHGSRQAAIEFGPERMCADDDSVAAAGDHT